MKSKSMIPMLLGMMALAEMEYPDCAWGKKRWDELDGIDIEKEYALIQAKKSNYSRSMRDRIVARYERTRKGGG